MDYSDLADVSGGIAPRVPCTALDDQGTTPPIGTRKRYKQAPVLSCERVKPRHRYVVDAGIDDNHICWAIRSEGESIPHNNCGLRPSSGQIKPRPRGELGVDLDRHYMATRPYNFCEDGTVITAASADMYYVQTTRQLELVIYTSREAW